MSFNQYLTFQLIKEIFFLGRGKIRKNKQKGARARKKYDASNAVTPLQ